MAHLAVFPKCFMEELTIKKTINVFEWIEIAASLNVEGTELFYGCLESMDITYLNKIKEKLEECRLKMPMFCVSPDFTHPDPEYRKKEMEKFKRYIDVTAFFGEVSLFVP